MPDSMHPHYMLPSVNRVCSHIVESADPDTFMDPTKPIQYWRSVPAVKAACKEISEVGHRYEVPEDLIDIAERIIDPYSSCYLDEITLSRLVEAVLT